jgi:hypothetical protein
LSASDGVTVVGAAGGGGGGARFHDEPVRAGADFLIGKVEAGAPFPIRAGDGGGARRAERDGDRLAGAGPAPDGDVFRALQNRVVGKNRGQAEFGAGVAGAGKRERGGEQKVFSQRQKQAERVHGGIFL